MKILDKYLLKSFLITFTTVFVILFFIFVLQVVWLFISELAGKDLDFMLIIKFLLFKMPSIIPLVLPLSVLLSSIMTFGSLAENYEFAAMKSSGISLQRAMRSLVYFIAVLSIVAFFFANNVIPYAEYKFINFRRNIAQVKPAMAIAEGQFSQVGTYNIKVEKKSGKNGKYLKGVTIHKLSSLGSGSNTVIKAKKGELISSEDSNILKLVLNDGNYYEDIIPKKFEDRNKVPFAKSEFKTYVINIDLSKLNSSNFDEEQITNTNTMLTVGELKFTLDSLQKNYNKDVVSIAENINQRATMISPGIIPDTNTASLNSTNLLQNFTATQKIQVLRVASGTVDATTFSLESSRYELENKRKNINQHYIALYDKYVIAFACLLMFFIGAPLGAIIRKGGLGLPIVFAILIFIIFHFINTFGKKVAQQDELSPFLGCWMSSFVLTPFAILLTKRATDDKGFAISFDWITDFFKRFQSDKSIEKNSVKTKQLSQKELVKISPISDDSTLKKSIPSLEKGVIESLQKEYLLYSSVALVAYFGLIAITVLLGKPETIFLKIVTGVVALAFYFGLFKSQKTVNTIGNVTEMKIDLKSYIIFLGGLPFYPLFYGYNRIYLKEIVSEFNKKS